MPTAPHVTSGVGSDDAARARLVLADAHAGLAGLRATATQMSVRRRRLVAWLAHDLTDAMIALQRALLAPADAPGEVAARAQQVTSHLTDVVDLSQVGRAGPRSTRRPGDFELAFRVDGDARATPPSAIRHVAPRS